jgi:hypothetical protein
MAGFQDNTGRRWGLWIDTAAAVRVRELTGFEMQTLLAEPRGQALGELVADYVKMLDVVFVLVKEQADRLSISDQRFGELLVDDARRGTLLDAVAAALVVSVGKWQLALTRKAAGSRGVASTRRQRKR